MPLTSLRRLIAHPIGLDRTLRPQDHDRVGGFERFVDRRCVAGAALDQRIPPHRTAATLQRRREALRLRMIAVRVTEENRRLSDIARHLPAPAGQTPAYAFVPRQGRLGLNAALHGLIAGLAKPLRQGAATALRQLAILRADHE